MSIFSSFQIAASGMTAERLRMDVTADNLANVNTTRGANGGPFRRREVLFSAAPGETFAGTLSRLTGGDSSPRVGGVRVAGVREDTAPPRRVFQPGHPDADASGYVSMPNISTVTEMVDLMTATRAYEANVAAVQAAKQMAMKALDISRG